MTQKFIIPKSNNISSRVKICGQDAKHICKVLRFKPGDPIALTDGKGMDYTALIIAVSPACIEIDIKDIHKSLTESPINITLCSGMLKDKKMDLVVKHTTQLGIYQWIPFFCERSVPTPDRKSMEKRNQRWETIAKESLKQCQRSRIPQISYPMNFKEVLKHAEKYKFKIAFWEKSRQKLDTLKKDTGDIIILIGPEGGFSDMEIQMAKENGFLSYSLGPRILRAETAAISSCTLIQHIMGDI